MSAEAWSTSPRSGSSPTACLSAASRESNQSRCDGASSAPRHCSVKGRSSGVTKQLSRPQESKDVAQTNTYELTRADEAFTGNRLLATFSREDRDLLEPFGTMVELKAGQT